MTLRCPVCRGHLSASDTIEDVWLEDEDAWIYRYACGSCLSVVSQRIAEISHKRPRVEPDRPKVDVAGSVVARLLEKLTTGAASGSLASVVLEVLGRDEERMLLRIPRVFALARPGWGQRVRLLSPAFFDGPFPRLPEYEEDPRPGPERFRLSTRPHGRRKGASFEAGDAFEVERVEGVDFVLTPESRHRESGYTFLASPDLVGPVLE